MASLWKLHMLNQLHPRPIRFKHEVASELISKGYLAIEGRFGIEQNSCLFGMKFNCDGSCLGLPSAEVAEIWSESASKLLYSLKGHQEIITSIIWMDRDQISSSGLEDFGNHSEKISLTSALDRTIRIWKGSSCTAVLTDHKDWIRCLGLSIDSRRLVSGCVSSVLCIWDAQTTKLLTRIPDAHRSTADLNTINSLNFSQVDPNLFVSGGRDGFIKMWDTRISHSASDAVLRLKAHSAKLNSVQFGTTDAHTLLSSGRDSAIRLWDLRSISDSGMTTDSQLGNFVQSYSGHRCVGYNVAANFYIREKYIISGSEDRCIYIYDKLTGKLLQKSVPQSAVIHLVEPVPNSISFLASTIDTTCITRWGARACDPGVPLPSTSIDTRPADLHRDAIEMLLSKYGDQLMKLFHQHNFAFSRTRHWTSLFAEMNPNDAGSIELTKMLSSMTADLARALQTTQEPQTTATTAAHADEEDEEEEDDDGDNEDSENDGDEDDSSDM